MRNILSVLILSLLFLTTTGAQYELSKGAIRKMDKTLESLWPDAVLNKTSLELTPEQKGQLSFKYIENSIYSISKNGKIEAYLFLAQARVKLVYLIIWWYLSQIYQF